MEEILKSPSAQRIIDFVAPVYGESYTALWLYEVIGRALDDVICSADSLRKQTLPQTATWALPYWEQEYGIVSESDLTIEQQQKRLLAKIQYAAPANPEKLSMFASMITGNPCDIIENISKNTFAVNVHGSIGSFELLKALIGGAKPAHLLMEFISDWHEIIGSFEGRFTLQKLYFPFRFVSYGDGVIRLDGTRKLNGSLLLNQEFKNVKLVLLKFTFPINKTENHISAGMLFGGLKTKTENGFKLKSEAARASLYERSECNFKNTSFAAAYRESCGSMNGTLTKDTMWRLNGSSKLDGNKKINAAIVREAL